MDKQEEKRVRREIDELNSKYSRERNEETGNKKPQPKEKPVQSS